MNKIIQIVSHRGDLIALTKNGDIYVGQLVDGYFEWRRHYGPKFD